MGKSNPTIVPSSLAMTSSYILVSITDEEHVKLVNLYAKKGIYSHTLFTANLPLMWKTCNGAGILNGGNTKWKIRDGHAVELGFPVELLDKRKELEDIVRRNITYEVVKRACVEFARKPEDYDYLSLFNHVHPSDWLLALCYVIGRINNESIRNGITGRDSTLFAETKALVQSPSPSPQKQQPSK